MTQHTPARWRAFCGKQYVRVIRDSTGSDDKTGTVVICEIAGPQDSDLFPFNKTRWDADARLIAAAPELLDALNYLEDAASSLEATFGYIREDYPERSAIHTHEGHTESYLREMIEKARAVIAKAEGRAP